MSVTVNNDKTNLGGAAGFVDKTTKTRFYTDFSGKNIEGFVTTNSGAGSSTSVSSPRDVNRPGIMTHAAGSDAAGYAISYTVSRFYFRGDLTFECNLELAALSSPSSDFKVFAGLKDSINATLGTRGIGFHYDRANDGDNWRCLAYAPTETDVDSGVAVTTDWQTLKLVVNAAYNSVEFFIGGISVGTVSTNLPTDGTDTYYAQLAIGNVDAGAAAIGYGNFIDHQILNISR